MRDEGIIKGWGVGVNSPEPILKLMEVADANVCLLARQYSLIDHENALHQVFPKARECGMRFVVGSSLNAGFISGSARYNYGEDNYKIPLQVADKRERLSAVAMRHGVDLRTAALKFSSAPDVAAALVVGVATPSQALADYASFQSKVPSGFWTDLKSEGLIEADAPVPAES
jgi:D-threo-aldose 1-dehydrogenase